MANEQNLTPFKKGQRAAAKPPHLHRNRAISIRLTEAEIAQVSAKAKRAGLSISQLGRASLGLEN